LLIGTSPGTLAQIILADRLNAPLPARQFSAIMPFLRYYYWLNMHLCGKIAIVAVA